MNSPGITTQEMYYIAMIFGGTITTLGAIMWTVAKIILPLQEKYSSQKETIKVIKEDVKELEGKRAEDRETIHELAVENGKLITEVKHLTNSVHGLSDKFGELLRFLNTKAE